MKAKNNLGNIGVDKRIPKLILKKQDVSVWTGFTWLRIVSSCGLL
jgi:hypothetical protein